jgi:serine protease Do
MKRNIALTLCAALLAGLLPDPALAQAVRTAPVAPAAGVRMAPAVAAPTAGLTASFGAPLALPSAPSLVSPRLAAPAVPAAADPAAVTLTVQLPVPAAQAQAAAFPNPLAGEGRARVSIQAAPESAPSAEAPVTVLGQARQFAAAAAPLAKMDAGAASLSVGRLFEGFAARSGAANAVKLPAALTTPFSAGSRILKRAIARAPLGRLLPAATAERWGRSPPAAVVDTPFTPDEFGGPKSLAPAGGQSRFGRLARRAGRDIGYGAKWALTLFGVSSAFSVLTAPLAALPWSSWVPHSMLGTFGRVELLTDFGPSAIAEMVGQAPLLFFGLVLPQAALMEEVSYRLLSFGITFGLLAAIRPAANALSAFLDKVPDLFGLRSAVQWALRQTAKVSGKAFTIASVTSAYSFAVAHFAAWGVNPVTLAVHLGLGLGLSWVAYRSRGLTAPVVAHFGYNVLSVAVGVLVPALLLSQMASLTAITLGIFGAAFAWYQYRSWKSDARAAADAARGVVRAPLSGWAKARRWLAALLMPALLVGAFATLTPRTNPAETAPAAPSVTAPASPAAPAAPRAHGEDAAAKAMMEQIAKAMGLPAGALSGPAAASAKPVITAEQMVKNNKAAVVMVRTGNGMGSGFIINKEGLLVTNAHVVSAGAHKEDPLSTNHVPFVKIRFANGREVPGKVVGFHAAKDLALIQLPPNPFGWPFVELADSATVAEGQEVVAMGHPRGLPFTVTRGIVSGTEFRNNGFVRYLQHDASVNSGNSGGPLFNMRGEVIGVNSMIITQSGGFDGISYAITAADVQKALDQYAAVGNISAAWLGAVFERTGGASPMGLTVDAVRPESPAAKAGLRPGDVVIGIDGASVAGDGQETLKALALTLRAKIPAQPVELQVYRSGGVVTVTVQLGAR